MSATQIKEPLPGEDLIGIEPALLQQVDAGWLQRLSLFTGRALSDTALTDEQLYRAGRLTMLGQAVTPGTVQGLDLAVDLTVSDPALMVAPGYGISATGQDVTLTRPLKTSLSGIAVLDGVTGSYVADFGKFTPPAGQPWAGVLLLQAILANVPGSAVDTGPQNIIVSGNLGASCDQDPSEFAFGDSQIVDGARLVLLTWPTPPATLALPPALPAATWRNRLVYTVFNAELALGPDDRLPWEFLGVPLALAGFDATSKLLFADRSAVVRTGGLPRRRYIVPSGDTGTLAVVEPGLANARVNQFAEQLGQILTPSSVMGVIAGQFALLPPSGVLPPYTMNFVNKIALWCPSNWTVSAAPVFAEELEGILQTSITAAPLDTTANETIEILVPLPDAVYDPNVLITEAVDPVFQQELNAATLARNVVLQHRNVIQLEANALAPLLNQQLINVNAGLTPDEIKGRDTPPPVFTPDSDEAYGTTLSNGRYVSTDLQFLQATANASYTVTLNGTQIPFFSAADLADLTTNGIQHFIDTINARLNVANDALDAAFLTAQTDMYRYRQYVLGATDATRLAVSPILANIATGDSAAVTAQNIQGYVASLPTVITKALQENTAGLTPVAAPPPTTPAEKQSNISPNSIAANLNSSLPQATLGTTLSPVEMIRRQLPGNLQTGGEAAGLTAVQAARNIAGEFTPISVGTAGQPANPTDITQDQPIVGAQLNLRTLTIAKRLAPPPTQEALFYSVANRITMTQLMATLPITVDDLQIPLALLPSGAPPAPYTLADLKPSADPTRNSQLIAALNQPFILTPPFGQPIPNPDEAGMFSSGIQVLEQHTQLLRAIEGRVQQYRNFLALCSESLNNVQSNMQSVQTLLTELQNDLAQARQNLAFVQALLADEQARVTTVNTTRASILQTYVQFVAFTRPRTLIDTARTPSRQLVPAAVASPVPACLSQSVAIPPELREMAALLREAPVRWFPYVQSQLAKLERPALLQDLAGSMQVRAAVQLQAPLQTSSAASAPGVYAASIASLYSSGQQTLRNFQTQRAAFDPSQLVNQSWSTQVGTMQSVAGVADLLFSSSVYTEVLNAASRSLQQISSVATCLYTRVGNALPAARLEWAEFLQNSGAGINLRSLAVLPGWNSQDYIDRQQMQLLVDWLFQQVDSSDQTAVGLMSDLIAVAILLASNAPVDNIIAGAVASRTKLTLGGTVRLTLPSDRVAHGMYVKLYSGGDLAAQGVVGDLDGTGVTATITDVYKPDASLQANDVAHFTALAPTAVVYKAFGG